jgi:hypothetical protein
MWCARNRLSIATKLSKVKAKIYLGRSLWRAWDAVLTSALV